MKLKSPPAVLDTRFEAFLQLLPEDYWQTAYDFQSFARARKISRVLLALEQ